MAKSQSQRRAADRNIEKRHNRKQERMDAGLKTMAFMAAAGLTGGMGQAEEVPDCDDFYHGDKVSEFTSTELEQYLADPEEVLTVSPFANLDL
jgi:hypothetical protein